MDLTSFLNPPELIKGIWRWSRRPKPIIRFEYRLSRLQENEYCHFRFNASTNTDSLFFRLGVTNEGKIAIEEADVRVEKIEAVDKDGNAHKVNSAPFFLHWANENTDNSPMLYFDMPVFVDFLYTTKGQHVAHFFHKEKHTGAGIKNFLTPGKWIVTVKLQGKNTNPIKKQVSVDFDGQWDRLKMQLKS